LINLFIVGYLEPYTHYRYEGLRFDLKSGALGASIKVGEFNQLGKHLTVRIDRSENKGTQLHGIFIQMDDPSGMSVAATADQGRFLSTDDPDTILLRLTKARALQASPKFATPRLARNIPRDSDHRRLSQGQSICRAGGDERAAQPDRGLVGAARGAHNPDLVDVPCDRPSARRPADRNARAVRHQERQGGAVA